jgi:PilZ domain
MDLREGKERRSSQRRILNRMAKIQVGAGTLPRDCLIVDISDGGVRLHVDGYEVPDEFVLCLSGDGVIGKERAYRVVWRLGFEIGAEFISFVGRHGSAAPA